jgi:diketogulonate reductase-like aldo/keto reductase
VFVTSKLNNGYHRRDDARRAFDATLSALGSEYVDLFLIHWPLPALYDGDFVSTWNVLEEFARVGRARSIGVSKVVLRWHIQRDDIVFPKSVHHERMTSNFDIFDFSLDSDEMDAITGLDRGETGRTGPNPDRFDFVPD